MSEYYHIFKSNLERVDSLCSIYSKLKNDGFADSSGYKLTDMLRAATVLLHSSFEEYYRSILTQWLSSRGNESTLKDICLPSDAGKHAQKYSLFSLLEYKDRTIDDLFIESVHAYMSRTTFNSYSEICAWATKIRLELSGFSGSDNKYPDDIDKAVSRRHKIVHEADTSRNVEKQTSRISSITPGMVSQWREAYEKLVEFIDAQVDSWALQNT